MILPRGLKLKSTKPQINFKRVIYKWLIKNPLNCKKKCQGFHLSPVGLPQGLNNEFEARVQTRRTGQGTPEQKLVFD